MDLGQPHHSDHVHNGDVDLVTSGGDLGSIDGVVLVLVGHQVLGQEGDHTVIELTVGLIWCSRNAGEITKGFLGRE